MKSSLWGRSALLPGMGNPPGPFPISPIECGLPGAVLVTVSVARSNALLVGRNSISKLLSAPSASPPLKSLPLKEARGRCRKRHIDAHPCRVLDSQAPHLGFSQRNGTKVDNGRPEIQPRKTFDIRGSDAVPRVAIPKANPAERTRPHAAPVGHVGVGYVPVVNREVEVI